MKTKLLLSILFITLLGSVVNATVPERKGWWKFDDPADLLKAEIGAPLVVSGSQESVDGPAVGNMATQIGIGSYLTMTHGIAANGGGSMVNEYTIQLDFSMPEASLWHALYQTVGDNSDDAELFINTDNFLGAWRFGYSTNTVAVDTWYRMIVTVKNGEFYKIYINGELWVDGAAQEVDSRDALADVLLLFADNDGEDNPMKCSEAGIWDVALTAEQAAELGDATTAPAPAFPTRAGWWKFDDAADMLKATIGSALTLTGTQESVDGPVPGNLATQIGVGSFLTMNHGVAANGGGTMVNEYSLQIDFAIPETGSYHALYQTAPDNSDDAELFVNTDNFLGAWRFGYSTNTIEAGTWYRMIVTVKNGEAYKIYIDGQLWVDGAGQEVDSRDALQSALLLFADNDGEDNTIKCSEVALWDIVLTADQVASLGDATVNPNGIFERPVSIDPSLLHQNYPNPCYVSTVFPYETKVTGDVTFRILDYTGKMIRSFNEGVKTPGNYTIKINTESLSNGVYYFQMITHESQSLRRMIVVH